MVEALLLLGELLSLYLYQRQQYDQQQPTADIQTNEYGDSEEEHSDQSECAHESTHQQREYDC